MDTSSSIPYAQDDFGHLGYFFFSMNFADFSPIFVKNGV